MAESLYSFEGNKSDSYWLEDSLWQWINATVQKGCYPAAWKVESEKESNHIKPQRKRPSCKWMITEGLVSKVKALAMKPSFWVLCSTLPCACSTYEPFARMFWDIWFSDGRITAPNNAKVGRPCLIANSRERRAVCLMQWVQLCLHICLFPCTGFIFRQPSRRLWWS